MTSVRRALALSLLERYLTILLALAGNIILARMLTPEQIGIYSVSLAVIGIAQVLRDFGIGNFLIQAKNLTLDHIRTAYGISLIIGGSLFLIVAASAPWIAGFYADERMVSTLRISAMNFLVLPFCTISIALLRRDMRFQSLLYVSLASAVAGFAGAVGGAWLGMGPDSMAIGAVAMNITTGLGAWLARPDRKLLSPSLGQWRTLVGFGAQSSAANIVTSISIDINDLVTGKLLGFAPVALLSRAMGLMNLFHRDVMGAVRNVAYPAFARSHREGEALEPIYVKSVSMVCLVAWPFYGFVSLFAPEIMRLMFGPQWDAAVPLVALFCLAGAFAAPASLTNPVIMASGRNDLVARAELIFQPLRAAAIAITVLSTRSLYACAMAYVLTYAIYIPFIYLVKQRCLRNDYAALRGGLWVSAQVCLLALAGPLVVAVEAGLGRSAPASLLSLLVATSLAGTGWLAGVYLFRHPITLEPPFQRVARWWPRPP